MLGSPYRDEFREPPSCALPGPRTSGRLPDTDPNIGPATRPARHEARGAPTLTGHQRVKRGCWRGPRERAPRCDVEPGIRRRGSRREVIRWRRRVIDADIRGFFDAFDPEILEQLVCEGMSDRRGLKFLHGWLQAGRGI
jgi:hypothetical protein